MSARVYFMKTVNGCVSLMSRKMNSEDGQVYSVCILHFFVLLSTTVCSQNINKQIVNKQTKILWITAVSVGITLLNQRII